MDYVQFVHGLLLFLLALALFRIRRAPDLRLPWPWLAWFGLLHGASEWLEMLAFSRGYSAGLKTLQLSLLALSFALLLEFARRLRRLQGTWGAAAWLLLVPAGMAAFGTAATGMAFEVSTRY